MEKTKKFIASQAKSIYHYKSLRYRILKVFDSPNRHYYLVSLTVSRLKLGKCRPTHPVSLKPLNYWDCWSESRWWHGLSSLVLVVCFVDSDFCDELITCTEESYREGARARARVCLIVCDVQTSTLRRPTTNTATYYLHYQPRGLVVRVSDY